MEEAIGILNRRMRQQLGGTQPKIKINVGFKIQKTLECHSQHEQEATPLKEVKRFKQGCLNFNSRCRFERAEHAKQQEKHSQIRAPGT